MQIKNDTDKEYSLYHDALAKAGASATQYPFDATFVRNANLALDTISAFIMRFDNSWEWHDQNRTTQPIADGDLVAGQSDYPLTMSHLKILRVRVKDQNGNYITLKPKERRSLTDTELSESGTPQFYDKLGSEFFLHPTPNYSVTGGIEIQFQQGASYFTTNDTTKEPGFAAHLHRLVSLYAGLDYAEDNGKTERAATLRNRIGRVPENGQPGTGMLNDLALFYSQRDYDEAQSLALQKSNRGTALL